MIKTLLVLSGAILLAVPAVHAQGHRYIAGRPALERGYAARGHDHGYNGRHYHGRYYYYGGVPYFYPYGDFAFGFGYPGYYAGWYGGPYGYGYGAEGGYPGAYEGRIANEDNRSDRNDPDHGGPSLPQAVQRQLSKKGYYKGSIDGQFGPESRSALSRFQREHDLKETGRIDEPTLDALGFTDHASN